MHKTTILKSAAAAALLTLTACAAPTGADFLGDAAATCGSPDMFSTARTFASNPGTTRVNNVYGCVDDYLKHSPEYQAEAQNPAADERLVATMRQIDSARASGQLTPEAAQQQSKAAITAHGGLD